MSVVISQKFLNMLNLISLELNAQYKDAIKNVDLAIDYIKLSNAVLTLYSDSTWDKEKLINYLQTSNYVYKIPKAFSGISVKIPVSVLNKSITIILFKSGKCVVVGITPKTIPGLEELLYKFLEIIYYSNCSDSLNFTYRISNKVYSFMINSKDFPGTLADWYNNLPEARKYFEYNPVMFPGATLRVQGYTSVILLFNSQKGIITGGKNHENYFIESLKYLAYYVNLLKNRLKSN